MFPLVASADAAEQWIAAAAEALLSQGVVVKALRNTMPLKCIEIAFDAPSISKAITSNAATNPIEDLVLDELKRLGVTPERFVVLNGGNQCVAPMRAKDVTWKGVTSIRCRPRVLVPLHCAAQLASNGSSFFIRTIAKRMCSGCGPASVSSRSWCKKCTDKKRALLRTNPSAAPPLYCFRCKKVADASHINDCIAEHAGESFSCIACHGMHRSPICPGIMRPLADTALGHRALGLSPTSSNNNNNNGGSGAPSSSSSPPINGGRASYAQAVGRAHRSVPARRAAPVASSHQPIQASSIQQRMELVEKTMMALQQQVALLTASIAKLTATIAGGASSGSIEPAAAASTTTTAIAVAAPTDPSPPTSSADERKVPPSAPPQQRPPVSAEYIREMIAFKRTQEAIRNGRSYHSDEDIAADEAYESDHGGIPGGYSEDDDDDMIGGRDRWRESMDCEKEVRALTSAAAPAKTDSKRPAWLQTTLSFQ